MILTKGFCVFFVNGGVVQSIAELLRLNVAMAMKFAFGILKSSLLKRGMKL